jgi:hypothetical protein
MSHQLSRCYVLFCFDLNLPKHMKIFAVVINILYCNIVKLSITFDVGSQFKPVPSVFDPQKYQGTEFMLQI